MRLLKPRLLKVSAACAFAMIVACASSSNSTQGSDSSLDLDADRNWVITAVDGTAVDNVRPLEGARLRLFCIGGPKGPVAQTGPEGTAQVGGASDLILGGCTLVAEADGYQRLDFQHRAFCPDYERPPRRSADEELPAPPKDLCPAVGVDATFLRVGKFDARDAGAIAQSLVEECFSGEGFEKAWSKEEKPSVKVGPKVVNKTMTHLDGDQIIATASQALMETGRVRVFSGETETTPSDLLVTLTMSEDSESGSKGAVSRYHASWQVADPSENVLCISTPSRRKVTAPARMRKYKW